jgi:GcrA cell cycle regulator
MPPSPATDTWTEARVELLKRLWLEGLSASQIAGVLGEGVTRNAVIGKVTRLNLSGRAKPAIVRAPSTPNRPKVAVNDDHRVRSTILRRNDAPPKPPKSRTSIIWGTGDTTIKAPTFVDKAEPVGRLTLLQLTEHTCKWPIGDPLEAGFSFCGEHSEEGKPYCATHSRRAYL